MIAWAASNGDRSENADYIYGKRRLREIDRRIRFLNQRLEIADVIDPARPGLDQVFFGATVTYCDGKGVERTVSIVGQDEVDPQRGRISWISPVARALSKAREGDVVTLRTPGGSRAARGDRRFATSRCRSRPRAVRAWQAASADQARRSHPAGQGGPEISCRRANPRRGSCQTLLTKL